ncbi:uncharacterized protein [Hetaerina americana]|uniref:uncharacterized protein n=1 Tax=Hetaerina americana TaxID=62018 RepID=UPI003A7F1626
MRTTPDRRPALLPLATPALAAAAVLLLLAVSSAAYSIPRAKRATSGSTAVSQVSGEMDTNIKVCHNSTPCGWAVYAPYTRHVQYFVKNTCECSRGRACRMAEDDLSASAFVYRCYSEATPTGAAA